MCVWLHAWLYIAINHLYKDRIYRQASKSCNSPNHFNLENQRLLFEILKRSMNECFPRWLLHKAFMYLVSRHQHSCCMTWLLPNQHLTIHLMMVEMVNICSHSINSICECLKKFLESNSFCSGKQQATLPASPHGARPTTVSPCNCTEAARPAH